MELTRYKNNVFNFFYRFIEKRQIPLWKKFFSTPRSQLRLRMFLLQNGNNMSRQKLLDELIRIGYAKDRQIAKTLFYRARDCHVLVEHGDKVSVAEPSGFVIRFGSFFDGWKPLIIVWSGFSIFFSYVNESTLTLLFAVLTFGHIIAWVLDDWRHTLKY